MHLSIHSKPPGFRVTMLEVDAELNKDADISSFFFGKQAASSFIPIADFKIEGNKLKVYEYSEDGLGQSLYFSLSDRKSTRLNSSHVAISYAVFCLKKK